MSVNCLGSLVVRPHSLMPWHRMFEGLTLLTNSNSICHVWENTGGVLYVMMTNVQATSFTSVDSALLIVVYEHCDCSITYTRNGQLMQLLSR